MTYSAWVVPKCRCAVKFVPRDDGSFVVGRVNRRSRCVKRARRREARGEGCESEKTRGGEKKLRVKNKVLP